MENNKNMTAKEVFRITLRCVKDIDRYVPGRIPCMILNCAVAALKPYVTIWFSAQFVNELAGQRRGEELWRWAFLTITMTALAGLISGALVRWQSGMNSIHNPRKERIFTDKLLGMDFADVDKSETHDMRSQILENEKFSGWGLNKCIWSLQSVIQGALGILGAIALTVSLFTSKVSPNAGWLTMLNHPLSVLGLLMVMFLLSLLGTGCAVLFNKKWVEVTEEATFGNRAGVVIEELCGDPRRQMDTRIYGQQQFLSIISRSSVFTPEGKVAKIFRGPVNLLSHIGENTGAIFTGCVYLFTCLKAWGGAFGIGSVTQYVGAITALSENITLLMTSLSEIGTNAVFLKETYTYLDIPNSMYQGSLPTEKRDDREYEVEFRDVSFKYPGSDIWALRHVNVKFRVGNRMAVVGENGSGKTTFIKLLCRLYDPTEGVILLNGIDIRKYDYRDYMGVFSVVFQDFQLLSQSLGSNVACRADYDRDRVTRALIDAGFEERLATMPEGLDTLLYKDFGENGVEVSGGEAQKIAIARALYKDSPFIILDEPTAALDPIAEAEIYSKFNDIAGDKTAIYISHRLSSCKFCDEIAVFHEGAVIQQGSHDALVADKDGKYYELWNAQAQYYTEKTA